MKITIIGSGYVGLVAGACFAESGNDVICLDVNAAKIEGLNQGIVPIYEPGLDELIKRNVKGRRLSFTTDANLAIRTGDVIFIAVGTPQDEDGSADLTYVLSAAETIAQHMDGPRIVVDKSTVPVGTAEKVAAKIRSLTHHEVSVVSNPEFLKEGNAIDDFMKPDRVVIGAETEAAHQVMEELYGPFVRTGKPILHMDLRSAEMTKYAANAFLATKISFMNEIANLCERTGADVNKVREGIGSDQRIGPSFLFPGIGYGGSCFPKDISALRRTARESEYEFRILDAVDKVNVDQKLVLLNKVKAHFGSLSGRTIAVWGLSFKPKTDDMREAPSLTIVDGLLQAGAKVAVHDPEAMNEARRHFGDRVRYAQDAYEVCAEADALCLLTEWSAYARPDFSAIHKSLTTPVVFDGRNMYNPEKMREMGFTYYSIGRRAVKRGDQAVSKA